MKTRTVLAAGCVVVLYSSLHLLAQETAAQRHQMATNQLKQIAAQLSAQCLGDIQTLEDWTKLRSQRRRELLQMLGLDPLPARTPLLPKITGRLERDAFRIEKIVFQCMPGLYVTGNSERIREADDNVGHSDPPLCLREARQWMQRWLKGEPTPLPGETNSPPQESAEALEVWKQPSAKLTP